MRVKLSLTTKVMIILLIMMLSITVVITALLIDQSETSIEREHMQSHNRHVRFLQLYEDVLQNRTVLWLDAFSNAEFIGQADTTEIASALDAASEYLSLNMQVDNYWLYQQRLQHASAPAPDFLEALVARTREELHSVTTVNCQQDCVRYVTLPLMTNDAAVPVMVVATRMVEILSLLTQSTGAHKVAMVTTDANLRSLNISSRLTPENRDYINGIIERLSLSEDLDSLTKEGVRLYFQGKHLLADLLPLDTMNNNPAYILVIQDISSTVAQANQYEQLVVGSAAGIFALFSVLFFAFLSQYGRKLMSLSRRLPLLAEHKFREFEQSNTFSGRKHSTLSDELDVLQHVTTDLATQLEEIDGQMAINTAKLEKMAMFDGLTGLPNRNMLTFQIEKQLNSARHSGDWVALMFMDLDDFKKVNDSYGHDVGDKLLKAAALRISKPLGETDIASRFGGDEFVVLLPDVRDREQIDRTAEQILAQFTTPIEVEDMQFYISVSIGIAITQEATINAVELLRHADIAMYDVKSKQGAGYRVYDAAMNQKVMHKVEMEREARIALNENQFFLALQPQLELKTRKLVGFEALLRWQHPERGLIPPGDFIPLLENTAFMLELDHWVIKRATVLLKDLIRRGFTDVKMAVNVSSGHFIDASLPAFLQEQVIAQDIPPSQLALELTETVLVADLPRATSIMKAIRDMGVMIAIDDFGTGYSSLSYLKSLPADFIKIDQSFIAEMAESMDDRSIVYSTIAMVRSMGLEVIAEGLETAHQYELLCQYECHQGQGYLISRPISEHALWTTLDDKLHQGTWADDLPVCG
ncbi:putative bifunctional diguanylate cyclase/phosphodiesterase [Alteromonas halophila]|uniref:EAL domain-containing protein n=1 Tax=Alteromonas halophila TaxID=516698 RepID=A0A918JN68_9ALTE|nr:EAL domain-containing protein [Alteromonas halophila]GGW85133.1 hypothetical protein GCM10007391_18750 [Alteromonas halophila]